MSARRSQSSSASARLVGLSVVGAIFVGAIGLAFYAGAPREPAPPSAPPKDPFAGLPPEEPPPVRRPPSADPFTGLTEAGAGERTPLNAREGAEFDAEAFEASLSSLAPEELLVLASEHAEAGAQLARDMLRLQQVSDIPGMHAAGRAALNAYQRANAASAHALERLEAEGAPEEVLEDVRRRRAGYVREIAGLKKLVPR
jgi:hypothetical protein